MDDIIQVVAFIVTIIVFVVSALRKQKKATPLEKSEFQETLEDILGIPSSKYDAPVIQPETKPVVTKTKLIVDEKPKTTNQFTEGQKAIIIKPNNPSVQEGVQEEKTLEFDLKEAIIYSAILQPKYF